VGRALCHTLSALKNNNETPRPEEENNQGNCPEGIETSMNEVPHFHGFALPSGW
jgi:hypothetical protein